MKTFENKLPRAASILSTAFATIFTLSFASTGALAQDLEEKVASTLQNVVVKGTEYQPNMVREDGSHLKVKKHLKAAKPFRTQSIKSEVFVQPEKNALSRESARSNSDPDFWIYDSFVTFTADIDYDGYYSSFTLEFDVDTVYQTAPIYAVIYTSTSDVFTPFYTTDVYNINGDNTQDAIIIENDLVTGFPSNDYELMIIIYDADTDELVAVADGTDDADLAFLSLESENYEYVETVVVVEHGGALGIWLIIGLGLIVYKRREALFLQG